jgi:hypothetical protein
MMRHGLVLLIMLCLSGCYAIKDSIHTEFLAACCIKPFYGYHYQTCKKIKFIVNDSEFEIPANFETDLASIPKIAWPIMAPAHSSLIRAAIVHDYFYRKTCEFTRYETDLIFYHILVNDGISRVRASIMFYAVRWFGWQYYQEDNCAKEFKGMDQEMREIRIASLYGHNWKYDDRIREEPA